MVITIIVITIIVITRIVIIVIVIIVIIGKVGPWPRLPRSHPQGVSQWHSATRRVPQRSPGHLRGWSAEVKGLGFRV